MRTLLFCFVVAAGIGEGCVARAASGPECSQYCNPEVSRPCGGACINKYKNCHKSWTTACVGVRPTGGKSYSSEEIKHVAPSEAPGFVK